MTNEEYDGLFGPDDDAEFVGIVRKNLVKAAYSLHEISPLEYVRRCRSEWLSCWTDEVFSVKLLIDNKLLASERSPAGLDDFFEFIDSSADPEGPFCVAFGLARPDGSLVGAPPDYMQRSFRSTGRRTLLRSLESDIPCEEPENPQVASHIICLFDVLGFSNRLDRDGIGEIQALYGKLIETALKPHAEGNLWSPVLLAGGPDAISPALFWLPLRFAYFSDSKLLWAPSHHNCVAPFLHRCLNVFCKALSLGVPLRGAITAGDLVLHKKSNVYLGQPLVEAARLEQSQEWLGVSLGVSVRSERLRLPFSPFQVMLWEAPLKAGREGALLSGSVLDWPRRWRELNSEASARAAVEAIRTSDFAQYYDNALGFVEYSDVNSKWFLESTRGSSEDA